MDLSVIIPTLNEARYLPAAIDAVRRRAESGAPHEVIVADCGSTDGTPGLARLLGAKLVTGSPSPDCRAAALNLGAAAATGDTFLFLDSDTILPEGYDKAISMELERPGVVGGAFEFALDGAGAGLRIVELINRVRYRIWPRYFGDQGIFVPADVFRSIGGYPNRRIMEASDFCITLSGAGKLALIRLPAKTSPRRFIEGGVWRVLANDIRIWWLDITGRPTGHLADAYIENNRARGRAR